MPFTHISLKANAQEREVLKCLELKSLNYGEHDSIVITSETNKYCITGHLLAHGKNVWIVSNGNLWLHNFTIDGAKSITYGAPGAIILSNVSLNVQPKYLVKLKAPDISLDINNMQEPAFTRNNNSVVGSAVEYVDNSESFDAISRIIMELDLAGKPNPVIERLITQATGLSFDENHQLTGSQGGQPYHDSSAPVDNTLHDAELVSAAAGGRHTEPPVDFE